MATINKQDLLGKSGYNQVVKEIIEKIQKAKADTLTGSEMLKEVYKNLSESNNITPLLTLKPFITGAEKIAGDDISLVELIKFIKGKITGNADLNFLIGMVKEEHFSELSRAGHPAPKETIKEIEEMFNKPSSVIEEGIKKGIFDTMKSSLLNKIKIDLNVKDKTPKTVKLTESDFRINADLFSYSPIGIKYEDVQNKQVVYLLESVILGYNRETEEMFNLSESDKLIIPNNYKILLNAVNNNPYNPATETFSLNENWDFQLDLNVKSGNIMVNNIEIPKEKIKDLLLESIQAYETNPILIQNFNKTKFLQDADRFIALVENQNLLIKFDNIQVIKNLNENSQIILSRKIYDNNEPKILYSNFNGQIESNKLFESFIELRAFVSTGIKYDMTPLFESHIQNEINLLNERDSNINILVNQQKNLNENIKKVQTLKSIAEIDSPALIKLNEQEKILNTKLNENLKDLNFYKNEFKLH